MKTGETVNLQLDVSVCVVKGELPEGLLCVSLNTFSQWVRTRLAHVQFWLMWGMFMGLGHLNNLRWYSCGQPCSQCVCVRGYVHWCIRDNRNRRSGSLAFSRDGRPSPLVLRNAINSKVHWSSLNMHKEWSTETYVVFILSCQFIFMLQSTLFSFT